MPDNDNEDMLKRLEAQREDSKLQQRYLEGVQALLTQLLKDQSGGSGGSHSTTCKRHKGEEDILTNHEKEEETIILALRSTIRFGKYLVSASHLEAEGAPTIGSHLTIFALV